MDSWMVDLLEIAVAIVLVVLNGFFVAAEFALVKIRATQLETLIDQGRPFAKTARWLFERLEPSLSACQLGITMASLALGWVGEPAFARLLTPLFHLTGIESERALHIVAFIVSFSVITALHLVIGEQAPKIFAIRRPEVMLLWCAWPLRVFYFFSYPLLIALNRTTSMLLRQVGMTELEHDSPHSEAEIRAMISAAHVVGHVSRAEHRLINAVFEFDDTVCRRIMVPRRDVSFFDVDQPLAKCFELARETKHTRYPLCNGSLDEVVGFVHMKDLVGLHPGEEFDLKGVARPVQKVPESMPVTKLLRFFQSTHQLLAFVVDEYGTVSGIVTLENVLEQIVGDVDDEFDDEEQNFVDEGANCWRVRGRTAIAEVQEELGVPTEDTDADTLSGYLTSKSGQMLQVGDEFEFDDVVAEVVETKDDRATWIRVTRVEAPSGE